MNERLQNLENNIAELREIKSEYSLSGIKRDKKKEWGSPIWLIRIHSDRYRPFLPFSRSP
jgi:hypothetical protein